MIKEILKTIRNYLIWLIVFGLLGFSEILGGPYGFFRFLFWILMLPILITIFFSLSGFLKIQKIKRSQNSHEKIPKNKKTSDTIIDIDYQEKNN